MKADKFTVSITVEVLSLDVVSSMLLKVIQEIKNEHIDGRLSAEDGDAVQWTTLRTPVEF